MNKLTFFVYWIMPGSPGHGPIHLLIQSAEELGRLVGFGLVFLRCV